MNSLQGGTLIGCQLVPAWSWTYNTMGFTTKNSLSAHSPNGPSYSDLWNPLLASPWPCWRYAHDARSSGQTLQKCFRESKGPCFRNSYATQLTFLKEWATGLKSKQRFGHIPVLIVKYEDGTSAKLWEGVAIDLYLAETLGFLPETQKHEDANFVKAECLGIYTSWLELSDKFSAAMARTTLEERQESVKKVRDDFVRLHVGFHENLLASSGRKGPFYFGDKVSSWTSIYMRHAQ